MGILKTIFFQYRYANVSNLFEFKSILDPWVSVGLQRDVIRVGIEALPWCVYSHGAR